MFINDNPAYSAAVIAEQAADASATFNETFVESFLTSLIGMLTDNARAIFWHVMDSMDPSYPNPTFNALELLRALRHASRLGISASTVIAEFGSVTAISLEGLLNWLILDHGFVLID